MITVIGGSGMLGGYICRQLRAAGLPVRVMTRKPENASELAMMDVQVVRGDLRDPPSLEEALRGTHVVVSSSHALIGGRSNSSEQVDGTGQRSLIDAAKRAGVEHFIFVSALGAASDHEVDFWRTKWKTEQYLQGSGLPHTIIRPAAFMDFHAYELLGKAVLKNKRVAITGAGTNPRNFVAAEDVASVVVQQVQARSPMSEVIEIGAAQNLSALEVVRAFESHCGQPARTMHLPLALVRPLSRLLGLVHPGVGRVLRAAINAETSDQKFVGTTRSPIPLMSLEQWIQKHCPPERH